MIALNGDKIDLTKNTIAVKKIREEFDAIKEQYGLNEPNKTVKFKYIPARIKPNPDDPRRPYQPESVSVPMTAVEHTDSGTNVWTYYENVSKDKNGKNVYSPKFKQIPGNIYLTNKDIELIWFLKYKCPHCANGENRHDKVSKHYIMAEDKKKEALDYVVLKSEKARAEYMILEGMETEQLELMLRTYMVPMMDDATEHEKRQALLEQVALQERMKKGGYETFNKTFKEKSDAKKYNPVMHEAKRLKVIGFKVDSSSAETDWMFLEDGEYDTRIVKGMGDPTEILLDYLKRDDDTFEEIKTRIEIAKEK